MVNVGYMDLKEAAKYCGVSVRVLQRILPTHLRIRISSRKILVKKSEIDLWLQLHREKPEEDLGRIADEAVASILRE